MSQVAALRRARERYLDRTPEQIEVHRKYSREKYWINKSKGKKQTAIPYIT